MSGPLGVALAGGAVRRMGGDKLRASPCARLGPAALGPLGAALAAGEPATRAVLGLQPALVEATPRGW